jgi:hypothetical protein
MQRQKRSYDWDGLKNEYLAGNWPTLNQFRAYKEIDKPTFYNAVDVDDWYAAKQRIIDRTLSKLETAKSNELVKQWSDYGKIWDALKKETIAVIKQTLSPDGKTIQDPLTPGDIDRLSSSIDRIFKNERLHYGQTTEEIGSKSLLMQL